MFRNWLILTLCICALASVSFAQQSELVTIGSNRELFVDGYLLGALEGTEHRLHHPVEREAVLHYDAPWEGSFCGYNTLIDDGEKYLLYNLVKTGDGWKIDFY